MPHREVVGEASLRQSPQRARGPQGLEPDLEGLALFGPLGQLQIGREQRAHAGDQAIEARGRVLVRPQLFLTHHEHRRPAQARVAPQLTHHAVGPAVEAVLVHQQELGIQRARSGQASALRVGDHHLRAQRSQLLREHVRARDLLLDQEHAATGEYARIRVAHRVGVEHVEATGG